MLVLSDPWSLERRLEFGQRGSGVAEVYRFGGRSLPVSCPAWVEAHRDTLTACLGKPVRPLDPSDDRLAALLDRLADAATWAELETALNGTVLRVYEVGGDRVRLDSTSAKTDAGVSEGAVSVRASQRSSAGLGPSQDQPVGTRHPGLALDHDGHPWERCR